MDIHELNAELRKQAIEKDACKEALREWNKEMTEDELVKFWLKHYDFAYTQHFPSLDFIRKNISGKVLTTNNIYLDSTAVVKNGDYTLVVMGDSNVELSFDGFHVCTIYVHNNSKVKIICEDMSKVFVRLFDDAEAVVTQTDAATASVIKYSKNCKCTAHGTCYIRESFNNQ